MLFQRISKLFTALYRIIKLLCSNIVNIGPPDFLKLKDLLLKDNVSNDFELIVLLEASQYNWVFLHINNEMIHFS